MPCPFFIPERRLDAGGWDPPPRLPLGDAWAGRCCADSWQPPEQIQREICNLGYARGRCPHFPEGDAPDAVRFSLANSEGGSVRVIYILEREHVPIEHGTIEQNEALTEPRASQMRAFLESYSASPRAL